MAPPAPAPTPAATAAAAAGRRQREKSSPFVRGMVKIAGLVLALAIYVSWKYSRGGYDNGGESALYSAREKAKAAFKSSSSVPSREDDLAALKAAADEAMRQHNMRSSEEPVQYDPDYASNIQIERTQLPVYNDKIRELEKVLLYYSRNMGEDANNNIPITLGKLGNLYKERYDVYKIAGGIKEAFVSFDKAVQYIHDWNLAPSNGQLYFELLFQRGMVHSTVGDGLSAIEDYTKALSVDGRSSKEYTSLHLQMAWTYTHVLSDPQAAIRELRRALDLDKCRCLETAETYSMYVTSLVDSNAHSSDKLFWLGLIDEIKIAFNEYKPANCPNVKAGASKVNYFWILHRCAQAANSSQAFVYLEQAHDLDVASDKFKKMKTSLYSYQNQLNNENAQRQMFEGELTWRNADLDHDVMPIFIVGFMRSGSTLLEKILATHPSIGSVGENTVMLRAIIGMQKDYHALPPILKIVANSPPVLSILNYYADWAIEQMKQRFFDEQEQASHSLNPRTKLLAKANYKDVKYIVDKTLLNYKYLYSLRMFFPDALFIHIARDPFDTLLSCYQTQFASPDIAWTLDKSMLSNEYIIYLRTMQLYRELWEKTEAHPTKSMRLIHIPYEGLVNEPDLIFRYVIGDKLDLPYDSSILNSDKRKAYGINLQTASIMQAQKNIYTSSIGRWKRHKREMKAFRTLLMRNYSDGMMPHVVDLASSTYVVRAFYNYELSLNFDVSYIVHHRTEDET